MNLSELENSDNERVSEVAKILLFVENDFNNGVINTEEYLMLLKDIERMVEIEEGTMSIEMKGNLLKGISALVKVL